MAETIAYDKPIRDYIADLSRTGHVTHSTAKKTSVTIHHNGGNLTTDGVMSTWRVRAASAHFDVDAKGNVAQFVKVDEYAWAVGNKAGNESSISIEMADATFAPKWTIADATLDGATRLAGWLFAHVIGKRPSAENVFPHKHWSSTDCPGPYVMDKFPEIIADIEKWYDTFTADHGSAPATPGGKKSISQIATEVLSGKWGNNPDRAKRLTAAGYNAEAVQGEVNRRMGQTAKPKKTVAQIAGEVLAGKWGNNPARANALESAGYDSKAVQALVNKLLK